MTRQSGLFACMMLPMHMFSPLLATDLHANEARQNLELFFNPLPRHVHTENSHSFAEQQVLLYYS